MKKNLRFILLLLIIVVLVLGLKFWANNSPILDDGSTSGLDPDIELAFAFSVALQYNDPDAYDMIDLSMKSRLDDWVSVHQSQECKYPYDVFLMGTGTTQGRKAILGCYGHDGWISFEVDNIVIKDMKVIDWGEINEGD